MMRPDRGNVLSPAERQQYRTPEERAVAHERGQLSWIEQASSRAAFEGLVGFPAYRVLEGAAGSWVRMKNDARLGEVLEQARRRRAIEDSIWAHEKAIEEIDRQAAAYTAEHARYDQLADEARRLARRVEALVGVLVDPNRMPTDQECRAYVKNASELQDLAATLLHMSGYRAQWGALSETAPAGRFSPSMHQRVLSRLPERQRGPWQWQKQTEHAEVTA